MQLFIKEDLKYLDNPVWNALSTDQSNYSIGNELAKRFPRDVTPFVAFGRDNPSDEKEMFELVDSDESVYLFCPFNNLTNRWVVSEEIPIYQVYYPHTNIDLKYKNSVLELGEDQKSSLMKLTQISFPDFFRERTANLGNFWGIFSHDKLISTAGERMRVINTFQEISTLCTHPEYLNCGYAQQVLTFAVSKILDKEKIPFAHIVHSNSKSLSLFLKTGFEIRKQIPMWRIKKKP
jgi:FR47-like protein